MIPVIPAPLYDRGIELGVDMSGYARQAKTPTSMPEAIITIGDVLRKGNRKHRRRALKNNYE